MSQDSSHYKVLAEITTSIKFVTRSNYRQSIYFWKITLRVIIWPVFREPWQCLFQQRQLRILSVKERGPETCFQTEHCNRLRCFQVLQQTCGCPEKSGIFTWLYDLPQCFLTTRFWTSYSKILVSITSNK